MAFSLEPIEITQIVRLVAVTVMYLAIKYLYVDKKLNKNTWGVKKVRGQDKPATKSSDIK